MASANTYRRQIVAATAASSLMLIFGLTYRVLSAQLGAPIRNKAPIDPAVLERFPAEIGGWTGQDVLLDEAIVRRTGTDAHINRRYSRRNGLESVCLYLACGVRARTLVGHRPEICYIAAGWTFQDSRSVEVPLSEGAKLPCSIFQFDRGRLDTIKMTVVNYFIVDGQYYGDVPALQSKAGRRLGTVDYVAQVQISSAENLAANSATELVTTFAVDSAPFIAGLFDDVKKDGNSRESGRAPEGE